MEVESARAINAVCKVIILGMATVTKLDKIELLDEVLD